MGNGSGPTLWRRFFLVFSRRFRAGRGRYLLERFPGIREMRICDIGGSRHFWDSLGIDVPRKNITIYNIGESGTEGASGATDDGISFFLYDGLSIPAEDDAFDLLVCNSVIEHVSKGDRAALAREMVRVAKGVFCQTPAYSFPLELHFLMPFIHWLPRGIGGRLAHISPWRALERPDRGVVDEYFRTTNLLKEEELRALFPGCVVEYERFMGLVKSYYLILRKQDR